jgi:hypothetical protein
MEGEDTNETIMLRNLYEEARAYIEQFHWNTGIEDAYLGYGIGGLTSSSTSHQSLDLLWKHIAV